MKTQILKEDLICTWHVYIRELAFAPQRLTDLHAALYPMAMVSYYMSEVLAKESVREKQPAQTTPAFRLRELVEGLGLTSR